MVQGLEEVRAFKGNTHRILPLSIIPTGHAGSHR